MTPRSFDTSMLTNFREARAFCERGRDGCSRPIANNTRLILHGPDQFDEGERIGLRLHSTDVVTIYPNGEVEFDSGGWETVTTCARMNYMPGYRVGGAYSSYVDGWIVSANDWWTGERWTSSGSYIFHNGIRFSARGRCLTEAERLDDVIAREIRERALTRRLSHSAMSCAWKAVRRLRRGLYVPDCDLCEECVPGMAALLPGDISPIAARSHFLQHIRRRTVSGGMIRTAMVAWLNRRNKDGRDWKYWLGLHHNANGDLMIGGRNYLATAVEPYVRKAVYSYLRMVIV